MLAGGPIVPGWRPAEKSQVFFHKEVMFTPLSNSTWQNANGYKKGQSASKRPLPAPCDQRCPTVGTHTVASDQTTEDSGNKLPDERPSGNNRVYGGFSVNVMWLQPEERQMLMSTHAIDWSRAVEDNRDWIGRVVAARVGTLDLLDDVIQEVNLAVARSSTRPTRTDEVAPWLCKIVVRQCALIVRNQVRQRRKLDGFHGSRETEDLHAGDPIFWLLHQERREIIRSELGALDSQLRQLLIWKYLTGLGYEEIGVRLGVSRHVAEYRVIEARKQLRCRLQARGIEGGELP